MSWPSAQARDAVRFDGFFAAPLNSMAECQPVARQSLSALPLISDVDLLGNCKCVIHLDAKIANSALDLAAPKKQLDGSERGGSDGGRHESQCRLHS